MRDPNSPIETLKGRLLDLGRAIYQFATQFQRELVGLVLILLSLTTLISLIISPDSGPFAWWKHSASLLAGWGIWPAIVLIAAAGFVLIESRLTGRLRLVWQQVVGWELAYFSLLGMMHLLGSTTTPAALAQAGRGGGYLGWAIIAMLTPLFGSSGTLVILILAMIIGGVLALRMSSAELRDASAFLRTQAGILWERIQPDREPWEAAPYVESTPEIPLDPTPDTHTSVSGTTGTSKPAKGKRAPRPFQQKLPPDDGSRDPTLPPLELLRPDSLRVKENSDADRKAEIIIDTLAGFGIPCRVVDINRGPTVTQFGIEPGFLRRKDKDGREILRKVRVSKIHALSNDLALALAAAPIRIEAPVPGRPYVGIEVPNDKTSLVSLRGIMESEEYRRISSPLAIALGRDVSGRPVAADLSAMPHLLIAGATGSGKSVCINALVTCLLCQNRPEVVRLLMIDPKRVELTAYNGVPHLVAPVVVDLTQVVGALNWVVREMGSRYQQFSAKGARHITEYNRRASRHQEEPLPYLIVVIDELADLMMAAPMEVEQSICRIAQMARATGIHLVIATQRPSVDVVTGLIKANFPARISFAVTSQVDSRVILDTAGAEKLLGRGDMLYMSPESSKLARLQGCFVSDKEIQAIVRFWQRTYAYERVEASEESDGEPVDAESSDKAYPWENDSFDSDTGDPLFNDAVGLLEGKTSMSTSYLQRALRIGYPRAARLMDLLEEAGYVGPGLGGGRSRDVLYSEDGEDSA